MLDSKLFERTLIEPAKNADRLVVVSGYASAGMVERHMQELSDLQITLTVGMARQGINVVQHQAFKKISASSSFVCKYWGGNQLIHAKVNAWSMGNVPTVAFAGSANYTNNGFSGRQKEVLTEVDAELGRYFRLRLGLASGEYVRYQHLQRYGRTHVKFEKIDNETYRLDFSPEASA